MKDSGKGKPPSRGVSLYIRNDYLHMRTIKVIQSDLYLVPNPLMIYFTSLNSFSFSAKACIRFSMVGACAPLFTPFTAWSLAGISSDS